MRLAFLVSILLAGALYTTVAFADLAFLSAAGRLGPGFFPRLIGIGLIGVCLLSLGPDIARLRADDTRSEYWRVVAIVAALSGALVALFSLIGGTLAMGVFLLVALSILNRGHAVQNLAVAVLLPVGIYLLFDVWLNASMPEGLIPSPI